MPSIPPMKNSPRAYTPRDMKTKSGEAIKFFEKAISYTGDDCLIWPYRKSWNGYAMMRSKGGQSVCRMICEKIHGPRPTAIHESSHSCGNGKKGCVTPAHLRWATPKENAADKIIHGKVLAGEKNPWSRLNAVQVHSIRVLCGMIGKHQREIAKQFGISQSQVSIIVRREEWRHVG